MEINKIFEAAVKESASDIHLVVGRPPILRIHGQLFSLPATPAFTREVLRDLIYSILTDGQKQRFEKELGMDFSYEIEDGTRFRVNIFSEKSNFSVAARLIPSQVPTMAELDMPQICYDLTREKQGLILVTGPTGCGKSSTLAAMIDLINAERTEHIITLEDPMEFIYKAKKSIIVQRQLGSDMISFAHALKHGLRQDPDVILVGEMRDLETISLAITTAETGHLVLSTLHTQSAAQTVDRILDVFPPHQQNQVRMQLSMTLKGVISQRLLPKIGGGRTAVREILVNTPAVANIIRENKIPQISTVMQTSIEKGMVTFEHELKRLVDAGAIEREVAVEYFKDLL